MRLDNELAVLNPKVFFFVGVGLIFIIDSPWLPSLDVPRGQVKLRTFKVVFPYQ